MVEQDPFNRSKIMLKGSLTHKKPTTSKIGLTVDGNGDSINLSKVNLIASAKPSGLPTQMLKTPTAGPIETRNNTFSTRTLSMPNKTPKPSIRAKAAVELATGQDISDDPLQRFVDLQRQYTTSQASTKMRARNTSANFESALSQKLKEVIETDVNYQENMTGQVLKSQRFKQKWQKKSHMAVGSGTVRMNSLPRGSKAPSMASLSQLDVQTLPQIASVKKLAAGINVAELDNDSQYNNENQMSHVKLINLVENGSVYSQRGGSLDPYNTAYYNRELMQEKGGEIKRILQKRQNRARATMAGFAPAQDSLSVSNKKLEQSAGTQQLELPQISTVRDRFKLRTQGDSSNSSSHKSKKNDKVEEKGGFELETMKRFRQKIENAKAAKPPKSPKATKQVKQVKEGVNLIKAMTQVVQDTKSGDSPARGYDKHREAISSTFDQTKVGNQIQGMTEVFAVKQGLGEALIDEMSIVPESDSSSVSKSKILSITPLGNNSTTVQSPKLRRNSPSPLRMQKMKSEVGPILSPIKMRSPNRHGSFMLGKLAVKKSIAVISEHSVSSPSDTNVGSEYELIEGLLDKNTALRVQKALRKKKIKTEKGSEYDFIQQALKNNNKKALLAGKVEKPVSNKVEGAAQSETGDFNSELDMYSEIETVKQPVQNRRRSITKAQALSMRSIKQADDSAEERGSDSESKQNDQHGSQEDYQQDYDQEDDYQQSMAHNEEHEAYEKKQQALAATKREDEQLCGKRLVKKIDDFVFQVQVEAGLPLQETMAPQTQYRWNKDANQSNENIGQPEESKNILANQNQKTIDKYFDEFRGQQAFYSLCKNALDSKWTDPNLNNPRMQYYAACTKNNSVAKPILSKIIDKALVLRDLKLNSGDAEGLRDNFMMDPELIQKLYLDHNGLEDNQLAAILEGLKYQKQLINLSIQTNTLEQASVEQIAAMLKRKMPDHLQELHLIHIKTVWQATEELTKCISQRNYLRKLSLIEVGLNDYSLVHLTEVIRTQKTLQALDISWNRLTPAQMRPILAILQKNRRLTSVNLAWNNIMEVKGTVDDPNDRSEQDVIDMLGKIIKHSRSLQHMNLSGTGLSEKVIYEMGTMLRRARAILSLHLSGNPGLSSENMEYLHNRIRCRPNEDIERFTRIQAVVKNVLRSAGASSNIISGINKKVERDTEFSQVHKNDPIEYSVNDQLVFQRQLGHKVDIPGSGQWYESSKNAVACKPHYKNECFIQNQHSYCIIFWSKGFCYKINPILSDSQTEEIRYEIDYEFGQQEDTDHMYENTNVDYRQLPDQVPFVCGSFTGWRYKKMLSLEEFNEGFDERGDPFEMALSLNQIRKHITKIEYCNEHEQKYMEIAAANERIRLTYDWRNFFAQNLRFKRPILFNSHFFYEKPSPDGTLPENSDSDDDLERGVVDLSSDDNSEKLKAAEETKEPPVLSLAEQEELRIKEEKLLRNPLPIVPDVSRFDRVFILPVFCKPGTHHYMVKYKDTRERNQANQLKEILKQEKRLQPSATGRKPFDQYKYDQARQALQPECFFYHLQVPKRTEEIPAFVKPAISKVQQREFNKEASVFKAWRKDTNSIIKQACEEDLKHWKGYRFIKSEEDRIEVEAVLRKHYAKLKDLYIHLSSCSVWPNVGTLDLCDFATKAKIIDNYVNISAVDRSFIASTLKLDNSSAPCNGLRRFEFLEILVRLANIKYIETKQVASYQEAVEKIIDCVLTNFIPEPWQEFRDQQLWTMDVNDLFEANLENLKKIYAHYKTPTKAFMEMQDCISMCTSESVLGISEKDISFCYGYCHMTVTNEARMWKKYQQLELVEFLEFIGRLAHVRFKNSSPELAEQPLVQKIEFILDDLMQGFGLQRFEVNIDVLEFSESDDDY